MRNIKGHQINKIKFQAEEKNLVFITRTEYKDELWMSPITQKHNLYKYVTESETIANISPFLHL